MFDLIIVIRKLHHSGPIFILAIKSARDHRHYPASYVDCYRLCQLSELYVSGSFLPKIVDLLSFLGPEQDPPRSTVRVTSASSLADVIEE